MRGWVWGGRSGEGLEYLFRFGFGLLLFSSSGQVERGREGKVVVYRRRVKIRWRWQGRRREMKERRRGIRGCFFQKIREKGAEKYQFFVGKELMSKS